MSSVISVIFLSLTISIQTTWSWEALPDIPSGRRSEYYVLHENGGYKYGFDTGNGIAAKQSADPTNQVEGHYFYNGPSGKQLDLKYTAGTQGFVPEGLENFQNDLAVMSIPSKLSDNPSSGQLLTLNADGSYSFGFSTSDESRFEKSDASNNVEGSYSYKNQAGNHDLSYKAGAERGFEVTGGSLSIPNGLGGNAANAPQSPAPTPNSANSGTYELYEGPQSDGSYSFGFSTSDESRFEKSDASNNVEGSYSYKNQAGNHDLSYKAGAERGFEVTGGSLSIPNGLGGNAANAPQSPAPTPNSANSGTYELYEGPQSDGSYSFGFSTSDQSRFEKSDASNNVEGSYSYKNQAGNHDLSYKAGAERGFEVTGGSLSIPNGLGGNAPNSPQPPASTPNSENSGTYKLYEGPQSDGSYSFGFSTSDQSRVEKSDASNNVEGSYSYKNQAGNHDLSYKAGAERGFEVTGGSLSIRNGLGGRAPDLAQPPAPTPNSENSGTYKLYEGPQSDGSYSFGFSTSDQSRFEKSDASNNVEGSYSYKNQAGNHDLSYKAGAERGFEVTGGSLSIPNGLGENVPNSPQSPAPTPNSANSGTYELYEGPQSDGSYSFGFSTSDQSRFEKSDASNNVEGSYSYKNQAGNHDLRYKAGAERGFEVTGGSLSIPNGLGGNAANSPQPPAPTPNSANSGTYELYEGPQSDGSYSFGFSTSDQSRFEKSDSSNNVEGSYSYKNQAGSHDLSYKAGANTGFLAIGGSLSVPNGLNGANSINTPPVPEGLPSSGNSGLSSNKAQFSIGNLSVRTYLPPSNEKGKFGYILDSKS